MTFEDRKPIKGQEITYQGKPQGVVERVDGNLCWVRRYVTTPHGDCLPFIWRFPGHASQAARMNNMHDWPGKDGGSYGFPAESEAEEMRRKNEFFPPTQPPGYNDPSRDS